MTTDTTASAKHMVHALNADTGAEQTGWPVDLNATANSGGTTFNVDVQNQRAALALVGGKVFMPYSGHVGDCDGYHGWVVGVDHPGTPTVSAWATRAIAGGIWGSSGMASDGTSIYVATGNSKSSAGAGPNTSSGDNGGSWGDSETVYKFPTSLTAPAMTADRRDYFVPSNWINLDDADADIGGTSPVLMDLPCATPSSLMVALGKDGYAYLLNRANLGGMDATPLAKVKVVERRDHQRRSAVYKTATASYAVFKGAGSGCPERAVGRPDGHQDHGRQSARHVHRLVRRPGDQRLAGGQPDRPQRRPTPSSGRSAATTSSTASTATPARASSPAARRPRCRPCRSSRRPSSPTAAIFVSSNSQVYALKPSCAPARRLQGSGRDSRPQGRPPTLTRFSTLPVAASMTETSFDGPLAVKSRLPSGLTPMPQGRAPTPSMRRATLRVATSMTATDSPRPFET